MTEINSNSVSANADLLFSTLLFIFRRFSIPVLVCCMFRLIQQALSSLSAVLAGQEGLEPPTCGFGDRCSAS